MSEKHELNANKIFVYLFVFTALEVGLSMLVEYTSFSLPKWIYWGGLMFLAGLKGLLILQEFMHFKFEGWIVKGLVAPTPFLIAYLWAILSTELANNPQMDEPIGAMVNSATGQIWEEMPRRQHGHLVDDSVPLGGEAAEH